MKIQNSQAGDSNGRMTQVNPLVRESPVISLKRHPVFFPAKNA
jgi:hypothetical protein